MVETHSMHAVPAGDPRNPWTSPYENVDAIPEDKILQYVQIAVEGAARVSVPPES